MRYDAVHRALDAELNAIRRARPEARPRVLDVGGGTGGWAVPLAASGCAVTVVEPSLNALAALQQRAADAGVDDRITAVQGDTDALSELVGGHTADLVLGHGVLEIVDDVAGAVTSLVAATVPGGAVSVLVANRYAAIIQRAVAGRVAEASSLLADPHGRLDSDDLLLRRFDVDGLRAVLTEAGLTVAVLQGHGVLTELVPGSALEANPSAAGTLADLELELARRPPLRDIAAKLHAIARCPG